MVKSRAEIQREYRERLKQNKEAYEIYLLKARRRKHKNYVPVEKLTRKERLKRNLKNKEYLQKHRLKKRINQADEQIAEIHETNGYESASTSDATTGRQIIKMSFPNRGMGARMRVTRALNEKRQECKKLKESYTALRRKYSTKLRAIQRMKQKLKESTSVKPPTEMKYMSPRSKTNHLLTKAGLDQKQKSRVKKQLLLGNTLLNEMSSVKKPKGIHHTSLVRSFSHRLIKKYRLVRRLSLNTGVSRKTISISKAVKLRRSREIDRNRELVIEFLSRDDNSRQNPGKKDKLKSSGENQQTRTLNDYLKNLYKKFISETPNVKLSLTSFCRIRPLHIKLTSFTSRSCCLCTKHQNMALCLKALRLKGLDIPLNPETFIAEEKHKDSVKENIPDEITYGQWKRVPVEEKGRIKMITKIVESNIPKKEFLDVFQKQTDEFVQHVNRVKHQYSEIKKLKEGLAQDEAILHMDFAENYLCKSMDEVQSAYWSQTAVTLHPIVIYFKDDKNDLKHQSIVIISDELGHNSVTVRTFIKHVIPKVKAFVPSLKKVHYWTDSPTSQYRNKFIFFTIANHDNMYGVKAVWNYFEAGHGKGPCDGLGGITKRLADEAVRTGKTSIQNAHDFYQWTQSEACTMSNVHFMFISADECQRVGEEDTCSDVKAVKGTLKLHAVVGWTDDSILVRDVSCYCDHCIKGEYNCPEWKIEKLMPKGQARDSSKIVDELDQENEPDRNLEVQFEVGSFLAATYNQKWYVGKVVDRDVEDKEVEVTFMKKSKNLYQWPLNEDKIWISFSDVICMVDEPFPTGKTKRMFKLSDQDVKKIQDRILVG